MGDTHRNAGLLCRAKRKDGKSVDVTMHDLPALLSKETEELSLVFNYMLIGRNLEDSATERFNLLAGHKSRIGIDKEIELHFTAIDMTVVIHNDGLNAAAIHLSDYLCDTNWISHLTPRPLLAEHGAKGASKTLPIHAKAAVLNVTKLYLLTQATFESRLITISRLPKSSNSRLDREQLSLFLIRKMLLKLIPCNGAGTNYGQITIQHIKKLRHLIDGALANKLTDLSNAGIVIDLALDFPLMQLLRTQILLHVTRIGDHATKLKNLDCLSTLANALLRIHRAAGRFKANECTHNGDRNEQQHTHQKTEHQIKQPFNKAITNRAARFNLFNGQCVPHRYTALCYFFSSQSPTYGPVLQDPPPIG